MKKPELLAPAGNFEMLAAALKSGADAVYLGISGLNMRARAKNFSIKDLDKIVDICKVNKVKTYLALNTIIYEEEIDVVKETLKAAKKAGIDAIICWDLSVIKIAKEFGLDVHLSTQGSASNSIALSEYEKLGVSRVILARECTLDEIKQIKESSDIEIEVFVHGAMCVSVSGRCFMSEEMYGKSANRGECIQPCRRKYKIIDPETDKELELDNHYVMSPKDLCTIGIIDKLIDAGIDAFKIEGRNRSPEYVKTVVDCYRKAIDLHIAGKLSKEKKEGLIERLKTVYNRGFSEGFFMGRPITDWTDSYGSKSTKVKEYVGKVLNYYKKPSVAEIKLESGTLGEAEDILIIGPTTGVIETKAESMEIEKKKVKNVFKGQSVGLKIDGIVRKNDKVYRWSERKNSQ